MNKIIRKAIFAVIALAPLVNTSGAFAHTVLISSTPAVGSTINGLPDSITLKFANPLLQIKGQSINTIQVLDPMKLQIASKPTISENTLSATLNERMKMAGGFSVSYRVAAQDGHVVTGNFSFTVSTVMSSSLNEVKLIKTGIRQYLVNANGRNNFLAADKTGTASGKITINFAQNTLCYQFRLNGLNNLTGAHIHAILKNNKMESVQDEVFVGLDPEALSSGTKVCINSDNRTLSSIGQNPSHYFLMIHTSKYPDGAIGGVLTEIK